MLGASSRLRSRTWEAVGTPASFISSLAKAFDPSSSAAAALGPKAGTPGLLQRVDEPGDQRRLGPDHDQVDAALLRHGDDRLDVVGRHPGQALGVGGDPGVAGRAEQLGGVGGPRRAPARSRARARLPLRPVPSSARPQSASASWSDGIAVSVWLVIVPREPSSTETLAIVFSSGASTTVMKSY